MKSGNRKWRTKNARRLLRRLRKAKLTDKAVILEDAHGPTVDRALALAAKHVERAAGTKVVYERARINTAKPISIVQQAPPKARKIRTSGGWFNRSKKK